MKTAIIYFLVLFLIFYGKNIYLYWYTIKCFRLISNNKGVVKKFAFKNEGKSVKNPRISFLGVLYFYVVIPPDMPISYIDNFLNSEFNVINNMLMASDLTGIIKTTKREFIEETEDSNYVDNKIYRYIIKFHPIFWYNRPRKFIFLVLLFFLSWLFIQKYGIMEYATIDNIKLVLSHIKDFFTTK